MTTNTGKSASTSSTKMKRFELDRQAVAKLFSKMKENEEINENVKLKVDRVPRDIQKINAKDFSNLELEADEYVTEFKAEFGTVPVGFESVINPYIFVKVKSNVKSDDVFTNKTIIEGYNKT